MKPSGRAYWLRSAIASYAGCNGTRPIAKVLREPCSAPRGESQAAAWQYSREYLLPITDAAASACHVGGSDGASALLLPMRIIPQLAAQHN